jgi:hypothetical protein
MFSKWIGKNANVELYQTKSIRNASGRHLHARSGPCRQSAGSVCAKPAIVSLSKECSVSGAVRPICLCRVFAIDMIWRSNSLYTNVMCLDEFLVPVEDRPGEDFEIICAGCSRGGGIGAGAGAGVLRGRAAPRERAYAAGSADRSVPVDPGGDGGGDRSEPGAGVQGGADNGRESEQGAVPGRADGRYRAESLWR